jgi:hypothetical protein
LVAALFLHPDCTRLHDFSFLLTDIRCNFLFETNLQRKSGRNGNALKTILQWYSNSIATVSSVRNYIFISGKFWGETLYATIISVSLKKLIPFCQER